MKNFYVYHNYYNAKRKEPKNMKSRKMNHIKNVEAHNSKEPWLILSLILSIGVGAYFMPSIGWIAMPSLLLFLCISHYWRLAMLSLMCALIWKGLSIVNECGYKIMA